MILRDYMLGEVAEMVKALFPSGCEATMENLLILHRNHISIERHVGLNYFKGASLVRFAEALDRSERLAREFPTSPSTKWDVRKRATDDRPAFFLLRVGGLRRRS